MKRVIKNKKKMKNTMYVVFGVFALALFAITRSNPSYANDGLMIDDALDAPSFTYGLDVTTSGEEYISSDGCYTFKQSTTTEGLAITDYNDECSKEIEIPSTVTDEDNNEFTVTEIGTAAFKDKDLTSIIIPDTIEKISCAGFLNNSNIETLEISRDYNVGGCAEFMQSKIKNLIISGDNIEKITGSFRELGIENLTLPNGLKEIGENAFINNNIGNVILPDTIEIIGRRAFQNNNISSIEFPKSTKTIGAQSFENNNISNISISGNIEILGGSAFNGNPLDGTFKIFGSVETVGGGGHSNTKNLTLDIGLETIPNSFYGTYFGVGPIKSLIINESVREIDEYAFSANGLYTENLEIKEGVEKIGRNAFASLQYSGTLTLPKSIKEIDNFAFTSAKIKELVIEEGSQLEKIGQDAFNGVDLEKVEIHSEYENGAELGASSFQKNSGGKIKTVILDGISIIGNQAFAQQGIESITLTEGLTEIGTAAFYDNNLDRIFLPKTINSIGNGAFCKSNTTQKVDAIVRTDINNTGMYQNACLNPIRGYNIKFINENDVIDETIYIEGNNIELPDIGQKEESIFLGWYESGATEPFDFTGTEILENKILYAKRKMNQYKIIFDTNGGNTLNPIEIDYNSLLTDINLPTPTKECNAFSGWDMELPEKMPAHDITLKAIWEYTCSRSSGGGGGAKKSESTTREIAIDTPTEQEHNSANEEQKSEISSNPENTKKGEIGQEIVIDGGTQKTVAVKNTEIVATVRNTTHSSSSRFTKEQNDAYSFAKSNGITTTDSIDNAKMNTELTRIQMAKMLSNYAVNVLGQEPDVSKGTIKFDDVTNKMDKQYDNAVTKAYQLGIMGQNMKNNEFRPNDEVTRAEFASVLSRLLYKTDEGKYKSTGKYYIPHVAKLYNEGIINKTDPKIKEKRGYVMTMLMRTVQ